MIKNIFNLKTKEELNAAIDEDLRRGNGDPRISKDVAIYPDDLEWMIKAGPSHEEWQDLFAKEKLAGITPDENSLYQDRVRVLEETMKQRKTRK